MASKLKMILDALFNPVHPDQAELDRSLRNAVKGIKPKPSVEKLKEDRMVAFETLLNGAFSISLNMNDTFAFACADAEEMSVSDFDLMVPVIAKYGQNALTAYAAVKRGQEPISCKCDHKNERYHAAKAEIQKIKEAKPDFMES